MKTNWDVIVIGAGMAGLSAAQQLRAAGKDVLVLEKSRGVGGRMATRRTDAGQWDHGAQYFTARSATFRRQIALWLRANVVSRWHEPIYAWDGTTLQASSPQQRFVGKPTMNAPLRAMAAQLVIELSAQVSCISRSCGAWSVHSESKTWQAPELVLAIPAPQVARLLPATHPLQAATAQVTMQPCWAVMISSKHAIHLPFAGLFVNETNVNDDVLSWIALDSSKAGRSGQHWVLHASVAWSLAHLDDTPDMVIDALCQAFSRLLKQWGQSKPSWQAATAHRWLYARGNAEAPITQDASDGLAIAGDWLAGGRVEGAYLSGVAAADILLTHSAN
ncbi:FAD-dependent oxidoreductase [Deefgea tanakiae]|uniref:FAD-dependent oxidoreductase n=1 Tax=Deefgea tanakiae TaxID=2865840 RepID=A0ABX8Z3P0_9NEIS|nr:FAD-dependent oxidoreductase [Deefgea tanakiae]QZA77193.1 FAD-dependent oxidoreductase [Deefgea tanakiae]